MRELTGRPVVGQQGELRTRPRALGVPGEHVEQRLRVFGQRDGFRRSGPRWQRRHGGGRVGSHRRATQRLQQVTRGSRLLHLCLGHAHAEGLFQPQHQLHARQAVDAQRALQVIVERGRGHIRPAHFAQHLFHDTQEVCGGIAGWRPITRGGALFPKTMHALPRLPRQAPP